MIGAIVSTLPDAAAVTERLVDLYGAEQLWQIEMLRKHLFRAWLEDGTVSLAIIQPDGAVAIQELEAVG